MRFFKWLRSLLGESDFAKKTAETVKKVKRRARDARGRFVADNAETEQNEAHKNNHVGRD